MELLAGIIDLEMPERNGLETAKWIRDFERNKKRKPLPLLCLTGHNSEDTKRMCIEYGMNEVFSKPIKKADILAFLKRAALHASNMIE